MVLKLKGIILHGGYGTRLRPLTHTGPKQLIPVANKPISQYVLEDLREAGIKDIAITLGGVCPEKVQEYYDDGGRFGTKITYIFQGEPKGIAHAVGLCKEFIGGDPFVVYLGDNLIRGGIEKYVETFKNSDNDSVVLLCEVDKPEQFGVAKFDQKGNLVGLVEKPKDPPSKYALAGIYFFKPTIFEMIDKLKPSWRGELEITEAIQLLIDGGSKVGHEIITGWWKDTGTLEDILDANRLVLDEIIAKIDGTVEDITSIEGRVSVGKGSIVEKGATLRGPVIVGHNSTIKSGIYIGPYTSVGNNATIERGEIENSVIMDGCFISVNDRIVNSLIGPNSKIVSSDLKPKGKRLIIGESSSLMI